MQDKHFGAIHLTNTQFLNIIFGQSGYGEVWYRAWFGSKRPRVRIPTLRPKFRQPYLRLPEFSSCWDSKGRHQCAHWCKKVSGGHFFSPWENPLISGRIPCGCEQKSDYTDIRNPIITLRPKFHPREYPGLFSLQRSYSGQQSHILSTDLRSPGR